MYQAPEHTAQKIQQILRSAAAKHVSGLRNDVPLWEIWKWLIKDPTNPGCQTAVQEVLRLAKEQAWPGIRTNANGLSPSKAVTDTASSFFQEMEGNYLVPPGRY